MFVGTSTLNSLFLEKLERWKAGSGSSRDVSGTYESLRIYRTARDLPGTCQGPSRGPARCA